MHPFRIAAVTVVTLAAFAPSASSAPAPQFAVPQKAKQGQLMAVRVSVASATRCTLSVRYSDGHVESAPPATARNSRISWSWRVAPTAALGTAGATVACRGKGSTTRAFSVVGPDLPAKVVIEKQGFSQRTESYGTDSTVSYGIVLANRSPQQDAIDTYVLVNFVDASNHVLGTKSTSVDLIEASSTYALGESMRLRTQAPVARLEITIQMHDSKPKTALLMPELQTVRILPVQREPAWVGEVDGEVVNNSSRMTLQRASFSIVIFDAAGQVVGGGTGSQFGSVPPVARAAFVASSGFRAIPMSRAASAIVSVTPSYGLS